jgi:hypothetical protein
MGSVNCADTVLEERPELRLFLDLERGGYVRLRLTNNLGMKEDKGIKYGVKGPNRIS